MTSRTNFLLAISFSIIACLQANNALAQGSQLDPPHNAAFGSGCLTCHDMSAWTVPNLIPDTGYVPANIDDTQYNNICLGCHDGVTAPAALTHSSLTTSNKYGDWTVECVVCHNQHQQEQDDAFGTTYGKFIRRQIDLSRISGLSKTGIKKIKFTGPADFADGDTVIDGICEVCHTQTAHFRSDGTLEGVGVHAGLTGTDCTSCHTHDENGGFTVNCGGCHATPPVTAPADLVNNSTGGAGSTGSATAGAHAEHSTTQGIGCSGCHYNNQTASHDTDFTITIGFSPNAPILNGGHYDGQSGVQYDATATTPATTVTSPGTGAKQCSNIYCHSDGTYVATGNTGVGTWNTPQWDGAPMTCGSCHGNGPSYANGSPKANSHVAHVTDSGFTCDQCHNTVTTDGTSIADKTKHVNGQYDVAPKVGVSFNYTPSAIQDGSGGTCAAVSCHSNVDATWGVGEHVMPTVPLCLNCHTATNDPYFGTGEVHENQGCDTCHDPGANGALIGSAVGALSGDGCQNCHSSYFYGHSHHSNNATVISNTSSTTNTVNCTGCHTASTTPFVGVGEVHNSNSCATCHNTATDGSLRAGTLGDATVADGGIATDGALECGECHTAYFDGHTVHTATGGHDVTFNATNDKTVGGSVCNTCHGADGADGGTAVLDSWDEIYTLHVNCQKCHDYDGTNGTYNNTPVADVNTTIASGVGNTCVSCHTDKDGPATHGGHNATDWDYTLIANDCKDCHADGGLGTIAGVHNDTCTLCHVDPAGGDYTRQVGVGGDGDATLAVGRTGDCLTCHPGATYTKTSIHHDTANAIASPTSGCTTACHNTTTGHAGDHSSIVTDAALCANCHTATAPTGVDNVPVDSTPGNLVHDYCTSCHVNPSNDLIDTITPPSANGYVPTTMNNADGTTDTTNGGGSCTACHTTYFDTHTHDHTSTVIVNTASNSNTVDCIGCHTTATAGTGPFTSSVHSSNGCVTCHDAGTGALKAGTVGDASVADGGITTDGALECGECHAAYFAGHTVHTASSGHDVAYDGGTLDQTNSGTGCANCHGPISTFNEIYARHSSNCATCHDYDGTNGTYNNTPLADVTASIAGSSIHCTSCHTDKDAPAVHGNIDHTTYDGGAGAGVVKGLGTSCETCHDTGTLRSNDYYINTIHNASGRGCGTCHNSSGGAGSLVSYDAPYSTASGSNGLASLIGVTKDYETLNENGGFCTDCHDLYATSAANHVNATNHDGQLDTESNCSECHPESGSQVQNVVHSAIGCSGCHDTAAGYIMKAGTSAANHTYGTSPETCTGCHTGATSEFDGVTTIHVTGGTDTHASMLLSNAQCTGCHTGNIQTVVHSTCQACHISAANGSFSDGTTAAGPYGTIAIGDATVHTKGVASYCTDCHSVTGRNYATNFTVHDATTRDANHTAFVTGTGSAKCTDCHGTTNIITTIHTNTCENCHTNTTTDGRFTNGTSAAGAMGTTSVGDATGHTLGVASTCLTCHAIRNGDFSSHVSDTHATALAGDSKCTSCHNGADIVINVHNSACNNCHIDSTNDGRFSDGTTTLGKLGTTSVGTATGHIIGGTSTCLNCHAAYGTDFDGSHVSETHDDAGHSELTGSGAAQCTGCHGTTTIISGIHGNLCETCHTDVTPAGGEDGTLVVGTGSSSPWGTTAVGNATLHTVGGSSGCTVCHPTQTANFAAHQSDTHDSMLANYNDNATPSKDCNNCHVAGTGTAVRDTIHSSSTCNNCHINTTTDGRLSDGTTAGGSQGTTSVGDATLHTIGVQSNCTTCHGVGYFQYHTYGSAHVGVSYDGGVNDTSQSGAQGCGTSSCHNDAGTNLANWAAIRTEHNKAAGSLTNGCVRCHDYDGSNGGGNNTPAAAVTTAISNGSGGGNNETCADCHTDKVPNVDHGGHSDSQFAPDAICIDCHNGGASVVGTIHDRCGICHVSANGGGTKHGSAAGKTLSPARACTYCHSSITDQATKVAFHHSTDKALVGRCDICHGDGTGIVNTSIAPRQLNCVRCHVEDTGSVIQIIAYDMSVQTGTTPVNPRIPGGVPGHIFDYNSAGATSFAIYDFRACLNCHSGTNPNYPTALVVKPFHGYPGDWTKGYLYTGAGPLPGPDGYTNGMADVTPAVNGSPTNANATQVPYNYQWYHPGPALNWGSGTNPHPGVRRFSSLMSTRISSANNSHLYDYTGGTTSNFTTANGSTIKDFGKNGVVMDTGESFGGGLDSIAAGTRGDGYTAPLFSQSMTVPYSGSNGWGGGDPTAPFTTVPTWPDVASGDVISVIKAEHDGTDLVVWAFNTLGSGATLSITNYDGGGCTGNFTWNTDHWEKTCAGVSYTAGDTVTVHSNAADSMDVTVPVNDATASGPAGNTLTLVTGQWVTSGDGAATGKLIVTAQVSDSQNTPQYAVDYATLSGSNLTWSIANSWWWDNNALTPVAFDGTAGALRIYDPGAVGDDQTYTVTNRSDVISIVPGSSSYNAGNLTVYATDAGNDPYDTGCYVATYNGVDYAMTWNSGANRFELNGAAVSGGYNSTVTVHCPSWGGGSATDSAVPDDTPVADDTLTIALNDWINNGNGSALGSLTVYATTDDIGNSHSCDYRVAYDTASNVAMTWNSGSSRFEVTIPNVSYVGGAATITITSTSPCDNSTTNISGVVNTSDSVSVNQADHDGTNLTVAATEVSGSCANTYYVDYPNGTQAPTAMTCVAGALTYTWTSAPAYVAAQLVTVHSATAGGDSATLVATDTSGGGGGSRVDHSSTGNNMVNFGTAANETCLNCHSGDTVYDVHGAECSLCHTTAPALNNDHLQTFDANGFITGTIAVPNVSSQTCTGCHEAFIEVTGRFKTWEHHSSDNAQNGNCVHCHSEARVDDTKWNTFPEQAPCAYCHTNFTRLDSGDGSFELKTFNFAAAGWDSQINSTLSTTHTIPNQTGGPTEIDIHDFAVCVNCHDNSDMFSGHTVVTGATAPAPPAVRPYHASGMNEDLSLVPHQASAPPLPANDGSTWSQAPYIPIDVNTAPAYNEDTVDGGSRIMNDTQLEPNRDDRFFAYWYHPGRGGITDTSTVLVNGSFNLLFKLMSPDSADPANPQYYKGFGCETCGQSYKHEYDGAGNNGYGSDMFRVPNQTIYNDGIRDWDFTTFQDVPYVVWDRGANPTPYWVTVPKFADKPQPTHTDKVRINLVDCSSTPAIQVYSQMTEDYHYGLTDGAYGLDATCPGTGCPNGKIQYSINGGSGGSGDMSWNGTSQRWEYNGSCSSGDTIDITSTFGDGTGSASTTAP